MRTSQVESQLSAYAASAARANRPAGVLILPGLLALASAFFALWAWSGLNGARRLVTFQQSALQRTATLVGQIRAEESSGADLTTLFTKLPYLGSQIGETAKSIGFHDPPGVGNATPATASNNPPIDRLDVNCTINTEPLDKTLAWIDAVQRHPDIPGRVFVTQFQVSPSGNGWRAQVRFSAYASK